MEDIDLARSLLEKNKPNPVMVKGSQVLFSYTERGVAPFFHAVQSIGKILHNAVAADRIVGSAVAMLCLYAGVTWVYAGMASQGTLDIRKRKRVAITSKRTVPHISNCDGTDLYPFEKLAASCRRPSQLFAALDALFTEGDQ